MDFLFRDIINYHPFYLCQSPANIFDLRLLLQWDKKFKKITESRLKYINKIDTGFSTNFRAFKIVFIGSVDIDNSYTYVLVL